MQRGKERKWATQYNEQPPPPQPLLRGSTSDVNIQPLSRYAAPHPTSPQQYEERKKSVLPETTCSFCETTPPGKIPLISAGFRPFAAILWDRYFGRKRRACNRSQSRTSLDLLSPFYDRVFYNNYKLITTIVTPTRTTSQLPTPSRPSCSVSSRIRYCHFW